MLMEQLEVDAAVPEKLPSEGDACPNAGVEMLINHQNVENVLAGVACRPKQGLENNQQKDTEFNA